MRAFQREMGVLLVLALTAFVFQIFSSSSFLDSNLIGNIFSHSAELGVVAFGVTILMIAGEFDLSVGSNFAFSGMSFALLTTQAGVHPAVALGVVLSCSVMIGFLNGWISQNAKIPSFITTLGAMMIWRGLVLAVSGGWPVDASEVESPWMSFLAGRLSENFTTSLFWWIGLGLLCHFFLFTTSIGNWIMAVGSNEKASRYSGVPVRRVKCIAFMVASGFAGLAGVIQFCRLKSFSPTFGEGLELEAIVVAVVGGTLLTGGVGSIMGTFLSTLLFGLISNGLVMLGAPIYWFRALVGCILILAVILNRSFRGSVLRFQELPQ